VQQNEVTLTGPSSIVAQVTTVVAYVNLDGRRGSIEGESFSIYAVDAQNARVTGVTLTPPAVNVSMAIVQQFQTRTISIVPVFQGAPAPGYWARSFAVEPVAVTVIGERSAVEGITVLRTKAVNLGGARADIRPQAELELPAGVNLTVPVSVTVSISIAPLQGTNRVVVAPTLVGLGPDLESTAPGLVEVTLSGDLPLLQGLVPSAVQVTLDLTGLRPGTHEIAPRITVPEGLTLVGASPAKSTVTLRPAPPPTPNAAPNGGGG
jgi:YbbR domain-containing protein